MVTFNGKHQLVFRLVPTAFAYAKLDECFGKLQKSLMEALQLQGDFADHLEVRKATKTKNRRLRSQMGNSKRLFLTRGIQFEILFARVANALSGSDGAKLEVGELRDVGDYFIWMTQ